MDPNVQVAIATVIGTTITTLGVIGVALINARRGKNGDGDPKEKSHDELLNLLQSLILENARKEATIVSLKKENEKLRAQIPPKEATA